MRSYFVYPGTTNSCAAVPPPVGTTGPTSAAVTAATGPTVPLANNQYGKFLVPVVSNESGAYTSAVVTGIGATIIGNTLNAAGTHREICFQSTNGSGTNLATLTINYTTTPASSTAVTAATATYGDSSVALSATVTSASAVNVGTVTFTVTQGAATVGVPTTSGAVTDGNANVTYALPAGLPAGAYSIEASYTGGTGVSASAGTGSLTINPKPVTVLTQDASKTYGECGSRAADHRGPQRLPGGRQHHRHLQPSGGRHRRAVCDHHHPGRSQQSPGQLRGDQCRRHLHHQHQAGHRRDAERQQDLRRCGSRAADHRGPQRLQHQATHPRDAERQQDLRRSRIPPRSPPRT